MYRIDFLKDEDVDVVAGWLFNEWGLQNPDVSMNNTLESIQKRTRSAVVPFSITAKAGEVLVGTASVIANDLPHFPQFTPWLAGVFVAPHWRGKGIADRLCKETDQVVRLLGFQKYFLFTYSTDKYYAERGWRQIAESENRGKPIIVMSKSL